MILWDKAILKDLTVAANRPDIVFKLNNRTLIIDVSCPRDSNITLKHTEKVTKYQGWSASYVGDFCVYILFVVVGALGIIKEGQTDNVRRIPGNYFIFEIQKSVLLRSMVILGWL